MKVDLIAYTTSDGSGESAQCADSPEPSLFAYTEPEADDDSDRKTDMQSH